MTTPAGATGSTTARAANASVAGTVSYLTIWNATLTPADYSILWTDDDPPVSLCQIYYSGLRTIVNTGTPAMVNPWIKPFFNALPASTAENAVVITAGMDGWTVVG